MCCLNFLGSCACTISKRITLNEATAIWHLHVMSHKDSLILTMRSAPNRITTMELIIWEYRILHILKRKRFCVLQSFAIFTQYRISKFLGILDATHHESTLLLVVPAFKRFSQGNGRTLLFTQFVCKLDKLHIKHLSTLGCVLGRLNCVVICLGFISHGVSNLGVGSLGFSPLSLSSLTRICLFLSVKVVILDN